ncbi:MAG: transposase [candidate division WOR-3 bacterium]|nr:transposase [candidate division WOR-3 bacterium]
MKKIRIYLTPPTHLKQLIVFIKNLMSNTLYKHQLTNLTSIAQALLEVKRPILSELAREIPWGMKFNNRLRRIWRFLAKSQFNYQSACHPLLTWILTALKDRKWLEIMCDWTKIRQYPVLFFSIPYHKRAIPLLWLVADPDDFSPNKLEQETIRYFLAHVPQSLRAKLVFVADRGYAKTELFTFLIALRIHFVIRVCGKVWVTTKDYQGWINWIPLAPDEIKWFSGVLYRRKDGVVLNLLIKHERDDPWYIVTDLPNAKLVLAIYGRRMLIEEGFRDLKSDLSFKLLRLSRADKVGKMLLVGVLVYVFVLLVGAQALKYHQLIEEISILPKAKKSRRLLSVFRIGLSVAGRCNSIKFQICLIPERR